MSDAGYGVKRAARGSLWKFGYASGAKRAEFISRAFLEIDIAATSVDCMTTIDVIGAQ
jgi:hypothetical protein